MYHGPYWETEPRTPSVICACCHQQFDKEHRIIPIYIFSTIATHPSGAGFAGYCCRKTEFRHADCKNPSNKNLIAVPNLLNIGMPSMPASSYPDIEPRTASYICARCKKEFKRNDRIELSYIIIGVGPDPETGAVEGVCSANFEAQHTDCSDPQLAGITGLVLT
jgi:hypothetical protein